MKIKPLADRVLVLPIEAEQKVGGIIIPDTAKEKPQRGKVVAVGNGTKDEDMILKVGDEVFYGKYAGTEIENEGEVSYDATKRRSCCRRIRNKSEDFLCIYTLLYIECGCMGTSQQTKHREKEHIK